MKRLLRFPSIDWRILRTVLFAVPLLQAALFGQKASPREAETTIGPEDTITVVALDLEEVSKAWRVGLSGDVSLPLVGKLHVAGKTVEQVEQEITERLKEYVKVPQVTVFVSDYRSQPVTVSGAVIRPGILQLQGTTTLHSAIVQAGGAKDAGPTVTVTRDLRFGAIPHPEAHSSADGKYSVVDVPIADAIRGDSVAGNLVLKPNDVVVVSQEKPQRLVYITGDVNKPGAIELVTRREVSITQLLAMAGGLGHSARPSKVVIRHIGDSGLETAFQYIDLRKVINGRAKDLLLGEGDIVVVPSSELTEYLKTMSTTALSSGVYILGRL